MTHPIEAHWFIEESNRRRQAESQNPRRSDNSSTPTFLTSFSFTESPVDIVKLKDQRDYKW